MFFLKKNVKHRDLLNVRSKKIVIHDSDVPKCDKTDYLGVRIDTNLSFTFHVSKILSTCYYIISSISYILSFCNFDARVHLFKSVIVPQLIYAVPVWFHLIFEKDKERIRRFLRYTAKDLISIMDLISDEYFKELLLLKFVHFWYLI